MKQAPSIIDHRGLEEEEVKDRIAFLQRHAAELETRITALEAHTASLEERLTRHQERHDR